MTLAQLDYQSRKRLLAQEGERMRRLRREDYRAFMLIAGTIAACSVFYTIAALVLLLGG